MRFGITPANRGALLGLTTVKQLLSLAGAMEASPLLDSVWVGDVLFVLAYGPPRDVIAQLHRYGGSGCYRIALRLATMGDATQQLRRLDEEVLPFVDEGRATDVS
jgi:hypothetical protein